MGISRRQLLTSAGVAAAGAILPASGSAELKKGQHFGKKRCLRVAHLTDIHVQPENQAGRGFERALEHAQEQGPDVIFTGGDLVMDSLAVDKDRMKSQWAIYQSVLKANLGTPIEQCIGNHDVWGWSTQAVSRNEPGYGKGYALDMLELQRPYRSFDRAGWHFIVLDSTFPKRGGGYTAKLDDEQFEWLSDDLDRVPKNRPVMVMSHIPILAVCPFLDGENEKTGQWRVPGAWMHIDARRIKDLFKRHANVKLCVSGHQHMVDRVKYLDVCYHCNGAVSGGWWRGNYQEFAPGYALIDLFEDGSSFSRYVPFGWKPAP